MNKVKNNKIKEYFITLLTAFLITFSIALIVQIELLFRCEKYVNFNELNVENLSKFCTIEELEKQLAKDPDDIIVNIRLAKMYEDLEKLDKANDFYKNALRLSGRSNFAIYSYAMFCARNKMYVFATSLAEELSGNSKRNNLFKAKIYEQVADNLYEEKNFPAATKSYQIVYKYAKSIGDFSYLNKIKEKYSDSYVKLADYYMESEDSKEAISCLKNSLNIKKNALANYKLGLLYLNNQPRLAEKHINSAFFENPYIVNPYVYHSLLQSIIQEATVLKQENLTNYYLSRQTRFKKKVSESYLYKDQLIIENSALLTKKTFFNKVNNILFFELKNNTKDDMNSLFVKIELHVNGEKYPFERKILNATNPLEAYETLKYEDLIIPDYVKFNDLEQYNDIFVRYYAKKQPNAPWVLVKIDFL